MEQCSLQVNFWQEQVMMDTQQKLRIACPIRRRSGYTVKNSEDHYLIVISVANYSDGHYILPQISLPGSDLHY